MPSPVTSNVPSSSQPPVGTPTVIPWSIGRSQAWPTVIRRRDGSLMLVYSGDRDGHICPFGRVEMMTSHDGGFHWTWPRTLLDSDLDDRDSGVLETRRGTLLVTTFSHTHYDYIIRKVQDGERVPFIAEGQVRGDILKPGRLPAWLAARDRLPASVREARSGEWMIRSTDGGLSWSAPYRCGVSSPHGPTELRDGTLLFVGKELRAGRRLAAFISSDDGLTWERLSDLPARPGDDGREYHEPYAIEAADGRIIVHLRNHNKTHERETLQCESFDGGKSWTVPRSIGIWGLPSHLLALSGGHLLMCYSHRRSPFGIRAALSVDHGESWSAPIELSGDSDTADLGYPSTVELEDGALLTVWYESLDGNDDTFLRQVRWNRSAFAGAGDLLKPFTPNHQPL